MPALRGSTVSKCWAAIAIVVVGTLPDRLHCAHLGMCLHSFVQFLMLCFFPLDNYFCFLKRNFPDQNLHQDRRERVWVGFCVCPPLVIVYVLEHVWILAYGLQIHGRMYRHESLCGGKRVCMGTYIFHTYLCCEWLLMETRGLLCM